MAKKRNGLFGEDKQFHQLPTVYSFNYAIINVVIYVTGISRRNESISSTLHPFYLSVNLSFHQNSSVFVKKIKIKKKSSMSSRINFDDAKKNMREDRTAITQLFNLIIEHLLIPLSCAYLYLLRFDFYLFLVMSVS